MLCPGQFHQLQPQVGSALTRPPRDSTAGGPTASHLTREEPEAQGHSAGSGQSCLQPLQPRLQALPLAKALASYSSSRQSSAARPRLWTALEHSGSFMAGSKWLSSDHNQPRGQPACGRALWVQPGPPARTGTCTGPGALYPGGEFSRPEDKDEAGATRTSLKGPPEDVMA